LTVRDDILTKGKHEIAICFHVAEDAMVSRESPHRYSIAVRGGTVTLELDERLAVQVLTGSMEPIGGWISRGYHRRTPGTTLIARGSCGGSATFLSRAHLRPV